MYVAVASPYPPDRGVTLLLHVRELRIYGYAITRDTAIWILRACLTLLLFKLTGLHALIGYVFLLHDHDLCYYYMAIPGFPLYWTLLCYMDYCYMSSPSCIPITWLFPVIDIDIPVIGYMSC